MSKVRFGRLLSVKVFTDAPDGAVPTHNMELEIEEENGFRGFHMGWMKSEGPDLKALEEATEVVIIGSNVHLLSAPIMYPRKGIPWTGENS